MNKLSTILLSGITALVVVLFGISFAPENTRTIVEKPLGAVSSPDIPSPYISYGGLIHWANAVQLNTATNTLCSIQSPAATSTLVYASVFFTSTTSPSLVQISKGTTISGTSTSALSSATPFAANQGGYVVASTSVDSLAGTLVFAPNQFLVVQQFGVAVPGTMSPTGQCSAEFLQGSI